MYESLHLIDRLFDIELWRKIVEDKIDSSKACAWDEAVEECRKNLKSELFVV